MVGEVILVAIDASKEITDYALEWAVRNAVKPSDSLVLLAILPPLNYSHPPRIASHQNAKGLFSRLVKKRSSLGRKDSSGFVDDGHDIPERIYSVCAQMIQQLFQVYKVAQVATEVKVVAYAPVGLVSMVAAELGAKWVILDRRLKKEGDCCLKQFLNCNILLIDHAVPKILRSVSFPETNKFDQDRLPRGPTVADMLGVLPTYNPVYNNITTPVSLGSNGLTPNTRETASSSSTSSSSTKDNFVRPDPNFIPADISADVKSTQATRFPPRRSVDSWKQKPRNENAYMQPKSLTKISSSIDRTSSVRRDMSLLIKKPPIPPPLCSVCKQKAPVLGKSPRRFSYEEIERATEGFSGSNFLAEGGYGQVYRGILGDGQVVAVKQHKSLSAQGGSEFCSEVEVLSCAQHKNLVMLIGYCIEVEWLLVYEFACNGSLDKHLYGKGMNEVMSWSNRVKVAIGAARGLRYLHEDCRVGCIVHRDFRPNNILLTHDFEPMVGDFGLARWQADGQAEEETRVVGAFGYLAPDYTQTGLITEKADVYAFGVVLLELLTGIKAIEFSRRRSRQFLERNVKEEMIDRRLGNDYVVKEVECMMHAATLCISPDPDQRPRMSKVLRILEGDLPSEMTPQQELLTSIAPKLNLEKNYDRERFWKEKQENYKYQKKMFSQKKLDPSRISPLKRENHQNTIFKPTNASRDLHNMVNDGRESNKQEKVGRDEYQEYLQGSLARYIQGLSVK